MEYITTLELIYYNIGVNMVGMVKNDSLSCILEAVGRICIGIEMILCSCKAMLLTFFP